MRFRTGGWKFGRLAVVAGAWLLVLWCAVSPARAERRIIDLGTLGGNSSEARAINASGQVAGISTISSGQQHACIWVPAEIYQFARSIPAVAFNAPQAIALDSQGNLYVADRGNHRIQKFDSSGHVLAKWGSSGSGDGQFNDPRRLVIDSNGDVIVADSNNSRVQKFTSSGACISQWGSGGSGAGQFNFTRGVVVDADGKVYVVDTGNERIAIWEKETSDTTPPTTAAGWVPNANAAGWNAGEVEVTLGASDNPGGSGVQEIHYRVDGGPTVVAPGSSVTFSVSGEGVHTIAYLAVDQIGNREPPRRATVNIDQSAPTTSASQSGNQFTLDATDALSGVAATYYALAHETENILR